MYERILVPIDGSETSELGLDEALGIARLTGGRLCLLHVIDELLGATGFEPSEVYTRDVLPRLRQAGAGILEAAQAHAAEAGVPVETRLRDSEGHRIADCIVQLARDWPADLVVIGSHGRRGAARLFMGSDAEHVLRLAPVPVLVVPGRHRQASAEAA